LLKTNSLGLPTLLEADNETHSIKEIITTFNYLPNCSAIVIRNLRETNLAEHLNFNSSSSILPNKKLGFVSKSRAHFSHWCLETEVKRKLVMDKKTIDLGNLLLIKQIATPGSRPRKGINPQQFEEEFFKKEYEYVAFPSDSYSIRPIVLPHLLDRGFKRVCGFKVPRILGPVTRWYNQDYLWLFAKD
jgi:hypothetical protein